MSFLILTDRANAFQGNITNSCDVKLYIIFQYYLKLIALWYHFYIVYFTINAAKKTETHTHTHTNTHTKTENHRKVNYGS